MFHESQTCVTECITHCNEHATTVAVRTSLDGTTDAGKEAFLMDEPVC